jgi:hypothetical protein
MRVRNLVFVVAAALAASMPAQAALTLEFIDLGPIASSGNISNFPASSAPATTSVSYLLIPAAVDHAFQVRMRDNLYAGPGTGTIPWQDNGGAAGPGSLGLSLYFMKIASSNAQAFTPGPTGNANAKVVDQGTYGAVTGGSSPPAFTLFGGILNFGSEPGLIPQIDGSGPGGTIPLFNIRVRFNAANYTGNLTLSDQNTGAADFTTLANGDIGGSPNPGTTSVIDSLVFGGPAGGNGGGTTFSIPFTVTTVPEPSSMALCGVALVGLGYRKLRRKTVKATA